MCKMTRETATVQMLTNRCSNDRSIENGRNDALHSVNLLKFYRFFDLFSDLFSALLFPEGVLKNT